MKKLLFLILSIFMFWTVNATSENTKEKINVYIFTKDGCPYCEKAKSFFNSLDENYSNYFNLVLYEVYDAKWNANSALKNLMDNVAKKRNDTVNGVPYIVIGNNYSWPGYQTSYDEDIKKAIVSEYNNENYFDLVKSLAPKTVNHSNDTIIIIGIFTLIIGSVGTFIYLSRKKAK